MTPAMLPAAALGVQAGSSLLGGLAGLGKARGMRQQAEANAYIGETRAIQTATSMQDDLADQMATLRATLAANGQGLDAGTMPFLQEMRRTRLREGRIAIGNERLGAADWRMQGRNAMGEGRMAFLAGVGGMGQSLFTLQDRLRGPRRAGE